MNLNTKRNAPIEDIRSKNNRKKKEHYMYLRAYVEIFCNRKKNFTVGSDAS